MRTRTVHIQLWLSKKEAQRLDAFVKKSGLSREAYLRHLISGLVPRDAPPPDYHAMMRELYRVGNNLNQIAQKAHALGAVDAGRYDAAVSEFRQAVQTIAAVVTLPEKRGE